MRLATAATEQMVAMKRLVLTGSLLRPVVSIVSAIWVLIAAVNLCSRRRESSLSSLVEREGSQQSYHSIDLPVDTRSALFSARKRNTQLYSEECHAGALCVGPGHLYPIGRQVGVQIYGEFVVPSLPASFDIVDTTYYDYINIFWRQNVAPGYMNQFVLQLMLGNALANSTNFPLYEPQWLELDSWHIGAQYFMAICEDLDNEKSGKTPVRKNRKTKPRKIDGCANWTAHAATGDLIAVEPGEGIFTKFELVDVAETRTESLQLSSFFDTDDTNVAWHLTMGVLGDPTRVSKVIVPMPFMGLIATQTSSWMEEMYDMIYIGSCLENYGMNDPLNYPSFWRIDMKIELPELATAQPLWKDWRVDHDKSCAWQPKSTVGSSSMEHQGVQTAFWEAVLETGDRGYEH